MSFAPKSLKEFVNEIVRKITYEDLKPPGGDDRIFTLFKTLLFYDTPYWKKVESNASEEEISYWFFLEPLSFRKTKRLQMGFYVDEIFLKIAVFDGVGGRIMPKPVREYEIDLIKSWLDHEYLRDKLHKIISEVLLEVNFANSNQEIK